jgi:uncharacterized Ntn-hydrolase superfamily protein
MTWSILVRDPASGALGAAVATRFFAVGALAIHVEGEVAALATQALINPMYALHGMARLRAGEPPDAVVGALPAEDAGCDHRQLHMIDAQGRIAQYTGKDCVSWYGSVRGTDVSVAGNMLAGAAVDEHTLAAFQRATGPLVDRLLTALEAGEAVGGDKRGKQSAAVIVFGREDYAEVDLRVDEHPRPVAELRRIWGIFKLQTRPFLEGMARKGQPAQPAPDSVVEMLLRSPPHRPGGGGSA